jgi:SAM-dependent methyltransferase
LIQAENLSWEDCACDWCGSTDSETVFKGPDRLEGLPGIFTMARCVKCGVYRQNPRLAWDSLAAYYPEDYASHPRLVQDEPTPVRRLDKRYGPWKRLRAVERYQPGGSLLEVGCGTGLFLEEALRSGRWQVTGVEPSRRAAEYAQNRLGVTVHAGRFNEVLLSQESFDAVVLWNVVEHLDQPVADLRYAQRLLKPGGWLVFSVPNLESLERRVFGDYWVGWDLPRHLYLFSQDRLEEILNSLGLRVAGKRCISTSYSVLGHSLDFWSQTWAERHPSLRRFLLGAYHSTIGRLAMAPPLWVLDRLNRSTILTFFAQKTNSPVEAIHD